jgi:hypothetical protein
MAQNLPRGTPARLLVLLTLLTGLVAVSAWRDALQRDRAVWVNYPTALGDTAFFRPDRLPLDIEVGGQVVRLTATGEKPMRFRDDRMFRVGPGLSEGLPFQIYTSTENPGDSIDVPLFAHAAPGEFLTLQAGLKNPPAPADRGGPGPAPAP